MTHPGMTHDFETERHKTSFLHNDCFKGQAKDMVARPKAFNSNRNLSQQCSKRCAEDTWYGQVSV